MLFFQIKKYTSEFVEFMHLNAISQPLPVTDIVLCREVLFHLSLDDGLKMIQNIKKSSKYLIATTSDLWFNSDIRSGVFRNVNLCKVPYNFPTPLLLISDEDVSIGRSMGVWTTSSLLDYSANLRL